MSSKLTRSQIAWRIAQDIDDGSFVNLGIGMPELVANYLPDGREIIIHSENGLLGMGPVPEDGQEDGDLINAGKKPVTLLDGGSYFSHTDSFAMVRGGHLDICVLGAFQISQTGDLANWATLNNTKPPGVGGAMDLAVGAKQVFVMTEHCTKSGEPKILEQCTYPLTGANSVSRIYTDLAVIDVTGSGLVVCEWIEDMTFDDLQAMTGAPLSPAGDAKQLTVPEL